MPRQRKKKKQTVLMPVTVDGAGNYTGGNIFKNIGKVAKTVAKAGKDAFDWVKKNKSVTHINKFLRETGLNQGFRSLPGGSNIESFLNKAEAKGFGNKSGKKR